MMLTITVTVKPSEVGFNTLGVGEFCAIMENGAIVNSKVYRVASEFSIMGTNYQAIRVSDGAPAAIAPTTKVVKLDGHLDLKTV